MAQNTFLIEQFHQSNLMSWHFLKCLTSVKGLIIIRPLGMNENVYYALKNEAIQKSMQMII